MTNKNWFHLGASGLACAIVFTYFSPAACLGGEVPSIESVESPAVERGSHARLKIVGANLSNAREVIFYRPGVTCQSMDASSNEELSLHLDVGANCPTGMHAFRVRTDEGFSELRTFAVTPYPILRDIDAKTKLSLGRTIIGQLADGTPDHYTISLRAGDRLALDVEAIRLGIELTDTAMVVRDPAGQVVAQADDSPLYHQDPILSLVAKQPGDYVVEVADAGRNSGQHAYYLLHVSNGPRPTAVYPLGGQAGSVTQLTFTGDARGKWVVHQELPRGTAFPGRSPTNLDSHNSEFQLFATQGEQHSATPLPFRLSDLANILETSANDDWPTVASPSEASKVIAEVPCALNGIIEQPLDRDCYWMRGIAGQLIAVDVYSQRLGSAADTKLTVVDSEQRVLAQSDDVDSLDSRVEFTVPKDGRFGVAVEEKRGKGGEGFAYRAEVNAVRPTAEVFLPRRDRTSQDLQTVAIPKGNRVLALLAIRKDDANGRATLRFPSLPKGTTAHFVQPSIDQPIIPVVFEADSEAELAGQQIPVEVTVHSPEDTAVGQFHQVTDLIVGPADAIYTQHDTDRLTLGTRAPYPVSVSLSQPKASLAQDGTLDLHVNIERSANFKGDVVLTLPWLPPWIDAEPRILVPADESQAVIRLKAWKQAEVATWPLVIEASAESTARRRRSRGAAGGGAGGLMLSGDAPPPTGLSLQAVASLPIQLHVAQPPARGRFESAAAEQGQDVELLCALEVENESLKIDNCVATLEGLPNRVETKPVPLELKSQTVRFRVKLEPTAPLGQYVGLACRLTGKIGNESVSYVVSRDGVLTIAQPGHIMRDASGRPLNRVEALRNKVSQEITQPNAR